MMMMQVNGYALSWSIPNNNGTVFLHFLTGTQVQVSVGSPQELVALGDILRTSSNVFFEPNTQVLSTPLKPPGAG
jgi:hypothetical protein